MQRLLERVDKSWGTQAIIGSSAAIEHVRKLVKRVADAASTVLIRGATWLGKRDGRARHPRDERRQRRSEPFIAVNCSALPGSLIESLVFGHEKGAFTGAQRRSRGQLELAGKGTILLDEIAEMPPDLQAKLLRVLEERTFRPLGAETDLPLHARVLAATHVDIERRITEGRFREDLFFRLNVIAIDVPSLADRIEDIPEFVLRMAADQERKLTFGAPAIDWLKRRRWPGNVRELLQRDRTPRPPRRERRDRRRGARGARPRAALRGRPRDRHRTDRPRRARAPRRGRTEAPRGGARRARARALDERRDQERRGAASSASTASSSSGDGTALADPE